MFYAVLSDNENSISAKFKKWSEAFHENRIDEPNHEQLFVFSDIWF